MAKGRTRREKEPRLMESEQRTQGGSSVEDLGGMTSPVTITTFVRMVTKLQ